jgi:hypothetical protein
VLKVEKASANATLGVTLVSKPGKLTVAAVKKGSAVEAAGLKAGDVIVAINGAPAPSKPTEATALLKAAGAGTIELTLEGPVAAASKLYKPVPSVKHPPAKKLLFLHGYADCAMLAESFQFGGLRKAFPGCEVQCFEGIVPLKTKEDFEHMPEGEMKTMAVSGDLPVFCYARITQESKKASKAQGENTFLQPAIKALEAKVVKDGGYDILCGFSQGGEVVYNLADRIESINKKVKRPVRMLATFGSNITEWAGPSLNFGGSGLKVFACQGVADSGFSCDSCGETTKDDRWNCNVCFDFDFCQKCYDDQDAAIKRLPASKPHKKEHPMTLCPFDHFGMHKQELVDKMSEVGVETETARCAGGHSMPKDDDGCYTTMAKFYSGTPTSEVPGAPRPQMDWSILNSAGHDDSGKLIQKKPVRGCTLPSPHRPSPATPTPSDHSSLSLLAAYT